MTTGSKKVNQALEKQSDLSLIVIDLDKFKSINDTHGHATGDIVLASVGKLLREHCQTNDHCIRFGGEEFVLILADKGLSDATQIAERYRTEIEALKPANLTVTASFGVSALLHQNDQEIGTIFARADQAAYESKKGGRNQVSVNAS